MYKGINMSIQSVNPFSNFKTNFNKTSSMATNPQQVQNNANESGKNSKKTAAIIGGLAALAFAGTVAAVAIKRHKVPNEVQSALNDFRATNETVNAFVESAQKQADEAMEYAQKLFDEVTGLFKKGEEIAPDGTVLRKITGDDTSKIMEEFSQDGNLVRKSKFSDGILYNVQEGIEELADGSRKVAKGIGFEDGTPSWYQEGYEELADGSRKIAKEIGFEDGTPSWYQEGYGKLADGSRKIAKEIGFEDGTPSWYQEGYGKLADGSRKIAKEYELTDKGWQEVSK